LYVYKIIITWFLYGICIIDCFPNDFYNFCRINSETFTFRFTGIENEFDRRKAEILQNECTILIVGMYMA